VDKPTLNININKDESHLNDFLYCWSKFSTRPNEIVIHNTYSTKKFNDVLLNSIIEKTIFTEVIPSDEDFIINDKMFVKISDSIYLSYVAIDRNKDNSIISEVTFLYKDYDKDFVEVENLIGKLNDCLVDVQQDENSGCSLNTLSLSPNGLEIEPVSSNINLDNIELYYPPKVLKNVDKLIKLIKKSDKGLSILYGPRGTGKTSMVDYISSKIDRVVTFIPNNMIDITINNPDFRKLLKRHTRPIIVIDDCEIFFNEFFTKSNMFVNNLLQLVDGFLSDSIEVNIVLILNVDDEGEIDHSLLDCNNLIDVIEFDDLSSDDANELSKEIGFNKKYKSGARLIDVVKNKKQKPTSDIGF